MGAPTWSHTSPAPSPTTGSPRPRSSPLPPSRSGPLLSYLYYGLIPCALLGGVLEKRVQHRKLLLWVPALCNTLFGVLITYTSTPWLLMVLLTVKSAEHLVTVTGRASEFAGPEDVDALQEILRTVVIAR